MAPFLASDVSLLDWRKHLKVDAALLAALRGLDEDARQTLRLDKYFGKLLKV